MSVRIHPQAHTIPKIRSALKDFGLLYHKVAKVFIITRSTAAKWVKRDDVQHCSCHAHALHPTLSAAQEAIIPSRR